jgi:hypothetical protein
MNRSAAFSTMWHVVSPRRIYRRATGQIGWRDRPITDGASVLHVVAGEKGAHLI